MIIKARSRTGGRALGNYLLNEGYWAKKADKNERIEIWEAVDVVPVPGGSDSPLTLQDKLRSFEVSAAGSQCRKPLYHVQFRTADGEHLTREQWMIAVNRLEQKLGLDGHDRAIVAHTLKGQQHVHVAWNRIDYETGLAVDLKHDGRKRVALARELEREFGLRELRDPGKGRLHEKEQAIATRLGKDPEEIKATIQRCYRDAANGQELQASLLEQGMVLAKGERREFLVVDGDGVYYGLGRVTGERAKAVREKLQDIDRLALPSVAEAKEIALERRRYMEEQDKQNEESRKREAFAKGEAEKTEAIGKQEQQKLEAIGKEEEQKKQAIAEEQQRRDQQRKDEAAKQSAFAEATARQAGELSDKQFQQQLEQQVAQLRELQQRRALEDAWIAQRTREAEEAKRARQLEGDVSNAHGRYAQALGQHYDVRDPYGSLSRAAMAEHARFMQERQTLDRQLAQEKDPEARKGLELRKQIEGAEYMAITDRRLASQSEIITGKLNSPEAVKSRERAAAFEKEAAQLREQYRAHQLAREQSAMQAKLEKEQGGKPQAEKGTVPVQAERGMGRPVSTGIESGHGPTSEPPLMVMDRRNGKQPVSLVAFVNNLPERPLPQDARAHQLARRREQQALDNISQSMKAEKALDADDVKNLPRRDLEQIKQKGDVHLRERVQQHQQAKEQARSTEKTQGRERER